MHDHIVRSGALGWGIKDSFRGYLTRQADFSLNVDDGASVGPGNAVLFPLVEDPRQRTYQAYLLPAATGMFNDIYDSDTELDVVTVTTAAMS